MPDMHNRHNAIVKLDNPELYVERLLTGASDPIPQAARMFGHPGTGLPDRLVPSGEHCSHRAAAAFGFPGGNVKAEQLAAYRGIEFGYVVLSCCDVRGNLDFCTGPLVTRLSDKERYERVVMNSAKLAERSGVIDSVLLQSVGVIDPLEEQPELAQYGMLMAFHMAGYGEMRKHQEYYGNGRLLVAQRIVRRELGRYLQEAKLHSALDMEEFEGLMEIPDLPDPDDGLGI